MTKKTLLLMLCTFLSLNALSVSEADNDVVEPSLEESSEEKTDDFTNVEQADAESSVDAEGDSTEGAL